MGRVIDSARSLIAIALSEAVTLDLPLWRHRITYGEEILEDRQDFRK